VRRFAEWVTGQPVRGFVAAALASLLSISLLPLAAWAPAAIMVLALLTLGPGAAAFAALGAMLPVAWAFGPVGGLALALGIPVVMLLPAYLAGSLLERTRSLSFTFQAVTIAVSVLLLVVHVALGNPTGALRPLLEDARPALEHTARMLGDLGVHKSATEIGEAAVSMAWRTIAWLVMLHTLVAAFAGLWLFSIVREPGLFGREFRRLRLGQVLAWAMVAALVVSMAASYLGHSLPVAEDLAFLLSAAFMIQALSIVHALKFAQVFGTGAVVLAYLLAALMPLVLAGVGFADTWLKIRERRAAVAMRD
jgi:hypothetical protein